MKETDQRNGNMAAAQEESEELIRVDTMYESLRYNEYSTENGLGEIIDNSVEAGAANIWVKVHTEKVRKAGKKRASETITEIAVIDDGCGMERDVLKKCLVLGESMHPLKNGNLGIGRFGVGMTLGGISLASRVEVYSRSRPGEEFLYTYIDLHEIRDGVLLRIPKPDRKQPEQEYSDLLSNTGSGTIVILKKCDRIDGNIESFANYLGRTYRKFIEAGLNITLNDEKIYLHDPLYMAGPTFFDVHAETGGMDLKARPWGEDRITLEIPGSGGKQADVVIRMSLLPKEWRLYKGAGGNQETKKRKIDQNEGISILRADREVLYGYVPYIIGKRGQAFAIDIDRWWGCEISFPPELDDYFQVRYIKRGAEPIASLRDQIREIISKSVDTARKVIQADRAEEKLKESKTSGDFGKAEETMAQLDRILPRSKKGQGLSRAEAEEKLNQMVSDLSGEKITQKERDKKKAELLKKPYAIEPVQYPSSVFFDTDYLLGKTIIKLNVNHPFYKHFFLPLCGPLGEDEALDMGMQNARNAMKDAVILLLFAYARAEAAFEDNEQLFDNLRSQWGSTLSAAINEYEKKKDE